MQNNIDIKLATQHFSVRAKLNNKQTKMHFRIRSNKVSTASFPKTVEILKKVYPEVLRTNCYNEQGLPFEKEVMNTELAHLFEHILIQKLAYKRYERSGIDKQYSGETEWCCDEDPAKSYSINLNANTEDIDVFPEALTESTKLVNAIMASA